MSKSRSYKVNDSQSESRPAELDGSKGISQKKAKPSWDKVKSALVKQGFPSGQRGRT